MSDEQNIETLTAKVAELEAKAAELETDRDKWKGLSRKNEDQSKANAEKAKAWDEHQESSKTEEEKRAAELEQYRTRAAELEKSLAEKDRAILVERVAASKGVPARYLNGETEDDLTASADQFLEDAKTVAPAKQIGYVGSQGTGDPTPPAASLETGAERARALLGK